MLRAAAARLGSSAARLGRGLATDAEAAVKAKLEAAAALRPTRVVVTDTSGGCGAMYSIEVESPAFNGVSVVKQHRMVKDVIKDDVAQWHGFTLKTAPSPGGA